MQNIDWTFFLKTIPIAFSGIYVTLYVSIVAFLITVVFSTIISLIRFFDVPILSKILGVFISFFRATPFIAQLFFLYFGLRQNNTNLSRTIANLGFDNGIDVKYHSFYG